MFCHCKISQYLYCAYTPQERKLACNISDSPPESSLYRVSQGLEFPKLYFWTSDPWSLIWYEALHWGLSTKHMGTWFPSRQKQGWFPSSPPPTPSLSMQNPLLELTLCSGVFSSAKVTLLLSLFISQIDYVMLCKAYSSIIITTSTQSNMLLNNIPVSK